MPKNLSEEQRLAQKVSAILGRSQLLTIYAATYVFLILTIYMFAQSQTKNEIIEKDLTNWRRWGEPFPITKNEKYMNNFALVYFHDQTNLCEEEKIDKTTLWCKITGHCKQMSE